MLKWMSLRVSDNGFVPLLRLQVCGAWHRFGFVRVADARAGIPLSQPLWSRHSMMGTLPSSPLSALFQPGQIYSETGVGP